MTDPRTRRSATRPRLSLSRTFASRAAGLLAALALAGLAAVPVAAQERSPTKLLRFPDVHGDRVVFSYAGDLWTASAGGGLARRVTAHPGLELFPKWSPDGRWIAFTGQYDGDEQVYVVAAEGGVPVQLTFYPARGPLAPRWGYDNQVYGWTPDGSSVLFRSLRDGWDLGDSRLYTVPREGGFPRALPMPVSGAGDLSPDGGRVVYSPLFRDFRTWKRYGGGWAQDLYVFDLETHETIRVTDHPMADRDPMWIGEKIYFTSFRDGTQELFAWDPATEETTQLTRHDTWDVNWPSADEEGRIVYELDGALRIHDVRDGSDRPVPITVPDDGLHARPHRTEVAENVEDFALSPAGERALFVARGDVFSAPVGDGFTRNLTSTPGVHEKHARWSPDGTRIAYVSDADGDEQLWVMGTDGSDARQLTSGIVGMKYAPVWSPDSERIVFSDKEGRVWLVTVASGERREVVDDPQGQLTDYTFSPDGRWLAFTLPEPSGFSSVHVHDRRDGTTRRVTSELWNDFSPVWGPKGDYLFYLSDRELAPQIASFEWNYAVDRETYVYALALRDDVPHPFPPKDPEVKASDTSPSDGAPGEGADAESGGDEEDEAAPEVGIDFEGLARRVVRVPIEADNYGGMAAVAGQLVLFRGTPFYYGRSADGENALLVFSMEDREAKPIVEGVSGVAISEEGEKVMVRQGQDYAVYEVKEGGGEKTGVPTSGLAVDLVPREEWREVFDEAWRRFRDFFYVENMHGYDWEAIGDRYRDLLPHVAHRSDLNYVMGEMVAELNVSHAYIVGGDWEQPERPDVALPGARLELDEGSGRYRIAVIYRGDNAEDRYRSPLTEVGVDVSEGDYLLAVDGVELRAPVNPYRLLRHRADRPVTLTVSASPSGEGSREVTFRPITDERDLRYLQWVERNRRWVDSASGGRVGYLHIPDMSADGIREFIKWYYGQIRKDGLVVDVRGNGGGNVSQMLIERLRRELLGTRFNRTYDWPGTYPNTVFHGHMVALINETSASDGDIFPHMFRKAGLGPLIGKRTWGGVIGISGHGPMVDGSTVFVPQFGTNGVDGSWVIENRGVAPDIEVENTPASVIEGRDLQLERGLAEVEAAIERDPKRLPERPAPPVKTPGARNGGR